MLKFLVGCVSSALLHVFQRQQWIGSISLEGQVVNNRLTKTRTHSPFLLIHRTLHGSKMLCTGTDVRWFVSCDWK